MKKKKIPSHKAYVAVPMRQAEAATMDDGITVESGTPVSKITQKLEVVAWFCSWVWPP
jgi:hypothetical protein